MEAVHTVPVYCKRISPPKIGDDYGLGVGSRDIIDRLKRRVLD